MAAPDKELTEIKKNLNTKNIYVGTEETMRALRNGKLAKVFIASNCSDESKADLMHYTQLSKVELVELKIPNDELAVVCKRPYNISVIGLVKV